MAFLITTLAGLSTLLGVIPILFKVEKQNKLIASSLAFSAGVMITVSVIDLIPEAITYLSIDNKAFPCILLLLIFFSIGVIVSSIIDKGIEKKKNYSSKLYKLGIISMIAIIMHNIPEGIATFLSFEDNKALGISLAIAIALHNIPEGISIAIPLYYSKKNKKKAFTYTLISALSEPLGAIIAYLFLSKYVNTTIMGLLLSMIAGIMIHIAFYELLPNSKNYHQKKESIISFLLGIMIMFICIKLLH